MASRKVAGIIVIALVLITLSLYLLTNTDLTGTGNDVTGSGKNIGQLAQDIALERFDGTPASFSDFRGQVLIVNSWAGWCPFCIDEMPDLQEASNRHGESVTVLFVHRTATEPASTGRSFLDDFPRARGISITDPVLMDPNDEFYRTYFGFGMPVTLFLDGDGVIREKKIGALTLEEMEEKIQGILTPSEPPTSPNQGAPRIDNIVPSQATIGEQVTIFGSGFTTRNTVFETSPEENADILFNVASSDGTSITFTVPQWYQCAGTPFEPGQPAPPCTPAEIEPGVHVISVKNDNGVSNTIELVVV